MTMATQKKEETVTNLTSQLAQAKGVILADYQGLNTAQLQELREKLKEQGCSFRVVKNTLLKIGLAQADYPRIELEGPTAAAFIPENLFSSLKVLAPPAQTSGRPELKAGFWEKEVLGQDRLGQLAKIPNLKHLKGLVVSSLHSPFNNLVAALNWNLNQLVFTLKQIQERG